MKLRNKNTGEIIEVIIVDHGDEWEVRNAYADENIQIYNSLAELNAEWEDVPTEEVWYLGERIGNYSMPKKEARKATEKILAWKRLKNKGFRFVGRSIKDLTITYSFDNYDEPDISQMDKDLDLLFGGEE